MIERFGVQLPELADLPAAPRGIVLHWTGGSHRANSVDLGAYHLVVEGDGRVRLGRWSVAANMRQVSGSAYAMHTGGFNSYRVGLSAAGMMGYEGPGRVGPYPLTEVQVERMAEIAGLLCALWGLNPLDPAHLCTHREVWTLHGVEGTQNHQKRDIEHLPFRPELEPDQVGDYLRGLAVVTDPLEPFQILRTVEWPEPEVVDPRGIIRAPQILQPRPSWWRRLLSRIRPRSP